MTERLNKIFAEIKPCKVFADVGCDHGYVAKKMLEEKKCERVIISDISEKCLSKAETLLKDEILNGTVESKVTDGFKGLSGFDCALISGMGGEEIIKILSEAKEYPERLILQPMKNAEKVRKFLVSIGYKIEKDFVFYSENKYYILISAIKGEDVLTEDEIFFGRTNILNRPPDFLKMLNEKIEKLENCYKKSLTEKSKADVSEKIARLKKYV